jgi:prepilin-type N-terminal cleavage/methylation domain-containing protein
MRRIRRVNGQKGFTIVELLIVIVVIGILAALVMNTFSSAQAKARNTQTISAVQSYAKALIAYGADKGKYPTQTNVCLGSGYTGTNGTCWSGANTNSTFNSLIQPYIGSTMPQPSLTALNISSPGATQWFRGAGYNNNGTYGRYILFVMEDTDACPGISGLTLRNKTTYSTTSHITCRGSLPPLN